LPGCPEAERRQRERRDLTRLRACLEDERGRTVNRIPKVLEDANLKLASVASDVLGKSGRSMWAAIRQGSDDAVLLSELACGRLRAKLPQLPRALVGRVTEHHRYLLGQFLKHLEHLEGPIAELDRRIAEVFGPFGEAAAVKRLDALPGKRGVGRKTQTFGRHQGQPLAATCVGRGRAGGEPKKRQLLPRPVPPFGVSARSESRIVGGRPQPSGRFLSSPAASRERIPRFGSNVLRSIGSPVRAGIGMPSGSYRCMKSPLEMPIS